MKKKIQQYLEGKLPKKEQRELLHWIKKGNGQADFESVKKEWQINKLNNINQGIKNFGELQLGERLKEKRQYERLLRFLWIYKYAAIALLMISVSVILFYSHARVNRPGLNLTEVYTEYGQVSGITLPDGSKAWINSGTKLSFNNQFNQEKREIKVEGEAFFSVIKNEKIPFVVNMGPLKVKVTGTRFGVSNYEDSETMQIVLEEGAVDIQSANDQLITKLVPDEMALFSKSKKTIEKLTVNPKHYTSWRNGIIHIYELPLKEVARKLEKRYRQKFEVDPSVEDIPFTFSIENESLSEILILLEKIASIKAVQKGDTITLEYE